MSVNSCVTAVVIVVALVVLEVIVALVLLLQKNISQEQLMIVDDVIRLLHYPDKTKLSYVVLLSCHKRALQCVYWRKDEDASSSSSSRCDWSTSQTLKLFFFYF